MCAFRKFFTWLPSAANTYCSTGKNRVLLYGPPPDWGATLSGHSSGRRGRWWHPTPPSSRSTSTHSPVFAPRSKTIPMQVGVVPKPLAEALELLVSGGWVIPGAAKGGVWYASQLLDQNAGTNMSLLPSKPKVDSGDPSGAFLHELDAGGDVATFYSPPFWHPSDPEWSVSDSGSLRITQDQWSNGSGSIMETTFNSGSVGIT